MNYNIPRIDAAVKTSSITCHHCLKEVKQDGIPDPVSGFGYLYDHSQYMCPCEHTKIYMTAGQIYHFIFNFDITRTKWYQLQTRDSWYTLSLWHNEFTLTKTVPRKNIPENPFRQSIYLKTKAFDIPFVNNQFPVEKTINQLLKLKAFL